MKRILLSILFSVMLLTIAWSQTAMISGKVFDHITREVLPGVHVSLDQTNYRTVTNDSGEFSIGDVPAGQYNITVHFIGYDNLIIPVEINAGINSSIMCPMIAGTVELESIQVTADPELQAQIISNVDIQLRSVHTSQDVLRLVPGLFLAQHAGGGKAEQIFLRGFDIDHGTDIAITTDGIPVNMVSHAHGQGYADLHYLIPETVDRVHFGKGPYHTHHGNMATAGYVGFQTRNVLDENTLSFQVGQFNSYRGLGLVNLFNNQSTTGSGNAYLAGEYYISDGYFESPQEFNRRSLFGKYNSTLGSKNYMTLTASTFSSSWDASGQIPQRAIDNGQIGFFGAIDDTEGGATSRSNANLQLFSTLNSTSFLKNQVYYSNYNFELYSNFTFFLEDTIHGDQIKQKENRNLFGYNGSYQRNDQLGDIKLTSEFGLQWRNDFSHDNELSHTAKKETILDRLAYGDIYESNMSAFLQETFRLTSALTVNAGLRYDHFYFSYKDQLNDGEVNSVTDNIISPKVNVYLQANEKIQLSMNAGYGFHSNDTRVVISQNGLETLPRAMGMDIGAVWKAAPRVLLSASLWRLHLDQEFVYVGDAAVVEPSGRTRRMGIEFSGRWQVTDWLYADADVNYTIARAQDEPVEMDYIPLAPRFSSIGGLTFMTKNKWNGSLRYRYLGDRPANVDNSIIAEGYTVMDAVISYRIKKYEIGLNVDNLFDVRWKEAQFETESRLRGEASPVSEIHFTPGTPFNLRAHIALHF